MKRAIFRSILACLCVYAIFSGFSSKSFANEKVRGFVISSESESKTIEKVNNRILDSANGSSSKISYVVNIDDKISFSLAGLLSLDKNGVVIPVKDGNIDENSKNILKNSEQVYVVGDSSSISDDVLNNLEIKFQRIGSTNSEDTNAYVNKFLGNRELLVVDVKESSDVLGAIHYAHIYNMNLYLFDSTKNINEKLISENENSIYFFDGVNSVKDDVKAKIYDLSKKDKKEIKSYSLDGKDLLKIFKDKYASKLNENVVLSERGNLIDMLSSYILADKSGYGYLIIDSNSMNLEIEKMLKKSNVKSLNFVSTDELGKYVSFRAILSSLNNEEVTGFEVEKSKNEIILSDLSSDKKGGNSVSEEVTVKKDETIIDGKVVSKEQEKTPETVETVKSGELNYSKVLTMDATSYTDDPAENGGYSTTRMGTPLRYGVVAVDPSVIPLGTKLYVEGYGYAVAEDTGGAIKGNRIDVCYTDKAKAHAFGRRNVKVYILK
ncbi:3D domain-containing protein [Parvimonas parva]|uniref:3D domain-containing protein n=1 Tax=Parvimonas parva TaxID=2769485 RepID=UPI0038B2F8B3